MDRFVQFLKDHNKQLYTEDGVILTNQMITFLEEHNGKDLVTTAHDFRVKFCETNKQAHDLIELWMDL